MKSVKLYLSLLLVLLTLVSCARGDKPTPPQTQPSGPATATFVFPDLSEDVTYLSITLEPKTDDVELKTSGTKNSSLNLAPNVTNVLESRFNQDQPGNPTMKLEAQSGSYTLTAYGYEEVGGAVTYSRVENITLRPGSVAVTAKGAEAPIQTNHKSLRLTPHIPPAHAFEGQEDLPTQSSLQLLSQENFGTLLDVQNIGPNASQPIGEVGRVVANQPYRAHWHEVSFKNSYTDPVVIMNPMSFNGKNPATARVRKVTPTGFEFRIDEWLYQDGRHLEETLSYLVVEKGRHSLGGLVLEAGLTQTDHKLTSVDLEQAFDQTPVILTQSQSFKGAHPVVTRHRNVTLEGFEVRLQEEESQGWHKVEDVAYVALANEVIGGFAPFEVATTEQVLNRDWLDVDFQNPYETPIFLGSLQTFNGPNTANVRYQNLDSGGVSLRIQEEKSMDAETWHRKEVAGYVVFDSRLELTPFEPEIPTPEIPIPGIPTPGVPIPGVPIPGVPTPGVPGIPVSDTFGLQLGTYDAQLSDDLALTSYERGDSDFQIFENTVSDSDGSILTEIALRNLGVESYEGLRLVVSDLSDGATFVGQDGITSEGNPYIDAGSLDSDELSSAFLLFDIETTQPFRYTLLIIEAQDAFGITDVSPQNFDNDAEQIITVTGHALTSDTMFFSGGQQLERIEVGSDTQAKLRVPRGYAADTYALSAFKLGNVSTELDGAFNVSEGAAPIQIDPIENYQSFFSGFVIDAVTSNTIPNATVKVESLEGVTGPTGMFLLQGAPIGTFTLSITAPGYTSAQRTVEITQSDETVFTEAVYLTPVDAQVNTERPFQTQSLPGCDIGIASVQPTFSTLSGGVACGNSSPIVSGAGAYSPAPDYDPLDEPVSKRRRGGRWIQVLACVQYADGPASGVYTNFGRTNAEGIVESWHYLPSNGRSGTVELKLELAPWEDYATPITTTFNPAVESNAAFKCITIPGNSNPNWDEFDVLEKLDSSCSINDTYSSASLSNHSYQSASQISTLNSNFNRPSPLLIRDQTRGFQGVIKRWDRRRFRGGKAIFEVEGKQVPYKLVYPHPDYKDSPLDLRNVQRNAAVVTANPRLPTGEAISVKFGARTGDRGVISTNEYTFDIIERIVAPKVLVLALPDNAIPDSIRTPYTVESSTNLGGQGQPRSDYGGYVGTVPSDSDSTFVPPPAGIGTTRPDEGTPNANGNVASSVTILFRESDLAADGTAEVYVPITAVGGSDSPLPDIDTNVAFAFANVDSDAKPLIGGRAEIPVRVDLRNGGRTDLSKLVVVDDLGPIGLMSIGTQSVSFGDCIETGLYVRSDQAPEIDAIGLFFSNANFWQLRQQLIRDYLLVNDYAAYQAIYGDLDPDQYKAIFNALKDTGEWLVLTEEGRIELAKITFCMAPGASAGCDTRDVTQELQALGNREDVDWVNLAFASLGVATEAVPILGQGVDGLNGLRKLSRADGALRLKFTELLEEAIEEAGSQAARNRVFYDELAPDLIENFGEIGRVVDDIPTDAAAEVVVGRMDDLIEQLSDIPCLSASNSTFSTLSASGCDPTEVIEALNKAFKDKNVKAEDFLDLTAATKVNVDKVSLDQVADWLDSGQLRSATSPVFDNVFETRTGLKFIEDSAAVEKHRIGHVLKHTEPIPGNPGHTVFKRKDNLFDVLNRAYGKVRTGSAQAVPNRLDNYIISMGDEVVGTLGETHVYMVVNPNGKLISAYPFTP